MGLLGAFRSRSRVRRYPELSARLRRIVSVAALTACVFPAAAAADWTQPVAGSLNVDPAGFASSTQVTAINGAPWVTWIEASDSAVRIKRLTTSGWQLVGGLVNDGLYYTSSVSTTSLSGQPYVAYSEENGSSVSQIHVRRFNGTSWVDVGGSSLNLNTADQAGSPAIADIGGSLYVAWSESNGAAYQLHVASYNGSSWTQVGSGSLNVSPTSSAEFDVLTGVGGVPYLAWLENAGTSTAPSQLYVDRFTSGSWQPVGSSPVNLSAADDAESPSLADIGGTPWLSWSEAPPVGGGFGAYEIHVATFNGSSWTAVGTSANIDTGQDAFARIASVGGKPLLGVDQYEPAGEPVYVRRWDGGSWSTVGSLVSLSPDDTTWGYSLASVGGVPYVATAEGTSKFVSEVYAKRLTPQISSESATPALTGAVLSARIDDYGVGLPLGFQYGRTPAFGESTALKTTSGTGMSTLSIRVKGLTRNKRYYFRAFGSDGSRQTVTGSTQRFTTLGIRCALHVKSRTVALKTGTGARPGVLTLIARCASAAKGQLEGTATAVLRPGSRRRFAIRALRVSFQAGQTKRLRVKLPHRALAELKAGKPESAAFMLSVRGKHGAGLATARLARIRTRR